MKLHFNEQLIKNLKGNSKHGYEAYAKGDFAQAIQHFEQGVQAGELHSNMILGMMYELGDGAPVDTARTNELFKPIADSQNKELQSIILNWYERDVADVTRAFRWVERLSATDVASTYLLGYFYYEGIYCERNGEKAFQIFHDLYEYNPSDTCGLYGTYLGLCYLYGFGVAQDEARGFALLQEASTKILVDGRVYEDLATCYLQGLGVQQDKAKAASYMKKASKPHYQRAKQVRIDRLERTWAYFGMFGR